MPWKPSQPNSIYYSIYSRFIGALASLRADQRGTVAVMMGVLLPILIGSLGVGFEISHWYLQGRAMQNAADAAAIAAASNNSSSSYDLEAKAVAAQYGFVDGSNNVTVTASNTAACPTGGSNTCYSVTITGIVPLYLSQVIGYTGDTIVNGARQKFISSTAIAENNTIEQPICLLALDQTGTAITTNGAPNSDFSGCTVMSNSDSNCNGSDLQATWGLAAGTDSDCGLKKESGVPVVPDPWAAMAVNIPPDPCTNYPQENVKKGTGGNQLAPGVQNWSGVVPYCGDVVLTGDVTIQTPDNLTGATLVIYNGQLDVRGHTFRTANGSALTVVFSGDNNGSYEHIPSDHSTGQGGVLNIAAPKSSSALFPGMAIYQDPILTTGVDIYYKGNNPQWLISGGVYLPNADVTISGDVAKATDGEDCFVMITNTLLVNGTSNIYQQTPNGSGCNLAGLDQPKATVADRGHLVF